MNWHRRVMLLVGVFAFLLNVFYLFPQIEGDLSVVFHNLDRSEEQRVELVQPEALQYCRFVQEHVSPHQTIGLPRADDVPWHFMRLTQYDLLRYFLFPRKVIPLAGPQDYGKVDAIVAAGEFPKNYPRDHYIPYPPPAKPLQVTLYCDQLRLTDRSGKVLVEDSFEYHPSLEFGYSESGARARRIVPQWIDPSPPPARFVLLRSEDEKFKLLRHEITSEKSRKGKRSELLEFQLHPMKDTWFYVRIPAFRLSDLKELQLYVWTDRNNLARIGVSFEDGREVRSLRNVGVYRWEKIMIEDVPALAEEYGFKDFGDLKTRAIVLTLMNFNYLIDTGLVMNR